MESNRKNNTIVFSGRFNFFSLLTAFVLAVSHAAAPASPEKQAEREGQGIPAYSDSASLVATTAVRSDTAAWQEIDFNILTEGYETYQVNDLGHPYAGCKNSIVRVAPELQG